MNQYLLNHPHQLTLTPHYYPDQDVDFHFTGTTRNGQPISHHYLFSNDNYFPFQVINFQITFNHLIGKAKRLD